MIAQDKLKHIIAGAATALVALAAWGVLAAFGFVQFADAPWAILIAASVSGATKEVADYLGNKMIPGMHGVEWMDFLATAAGALPVIIVLLTVQSWI